MSRHRNIRKNIASLMAGVFVWIVIGTLVNFHQHHVFGKVLIFHASSSVTLKKDEQQNAAARHSLFTDHAQLAVPAPGQPWAPCLCSTCAHPPIAGSGTTGHPLLSGLSYRGPPAS
ncbi:MAG TPA: hypothetical protein P5550_08365 [Bacteroidales bacterium]|nr:hypothetical protein [Bacteroidales bacterium]HRZ76365.1 hypothetical protein [Bacteroidales bacterium]